MVKVSGCSGEVETGDIHISEMFRPKSIQRTTPSLIGHPGPLGNKSRVSQRKKRTVSTSSLNMDSDDSFERQVYFLSVYFVFKQSMEKQGGEQICIFSINQGILYM